MIDIDFCKINEFGIVLAGINGRICGKAVCKKIKNPDGFEKSRIGSLLLGNRNDTFPGKTDKMLLTSRIKGVPGTRAFKFRF
jgi:hypothetical protein